jgi:two-component system, cell cycle sensor histidine kinase and response regulator CckA
MRALCRFVAGVAHEYNNHLNVINSNASELMADTDLPSERRENAQRVAVAGERAAHLTQQLTLFSGQQPFTPHSLDLRAFLSDAKDQMERLLGTQHEVKIEAGEGPCWLSGDHEMVRQVVAGLVANAAEASREMRTVILSTAEVEFTEGDAELQPSRRPGKFIRLTCRDSGEGMAASVLPHVFEPFFTTRAAKSHMGLGLSVIQGIVFSHDGWIEVDSQPGRGTEVRVFFPRGVAPEQADAVPPAAVPGRPRETILLVEDDDLLRETMAAVLNHAGYRVLQAESAESAWETWQWHADRITLLLTDVVLPQGSSGLDLAVEFRAESPHLRVICTSGFSHEIMQKLGDLPPGFRYLPKPCLPPQMLKAVRELLDAPMA